MSKVIWKYGITLDRVQEIEMPKDTLILGVHYFEEKLFLFMIATPFFRNQQSEFRTIEVFNGGDNINDDHRTFIGSAHVIDPASKTYSMAKDRAGTIAADQADVIVSHKYKMILVFENLNK